jgi:hypothetical protein
MRDRDATDAEPAHGVASGDQDATVRRHGRLHDADARLLRRVLPEDRPVGRETRGAASTRQHDLTDSVEGHQLR